YRDWVIRSFNDNLPYDEFVVAQIAGDLYRNPTIDQQIASGFNRLHLIIDVGTALPEESFTRNVVDRVSSVGTAFLGLTLGCARCHDHKYDPIAATDYYALYGVFASTRFAFPGCEPIGQPRDLVPLADPNEVAAQTADYQSRLQEYERQLQRVPMEAQRLRSLAAETSSVLAEANVGEGQAVSLQDAGGESLDHIDLAKGHVIQLTVLPNANHGADTTRIELQITKLGQQTATWNVSKLIEMFSTNTKPVFDDNGATWCLLDITDGPQFFSERKLNLSGQAALTAWSNGDTPSSVVNASKDPVSVWTTLPGESFFVHPGVQRNVAVAWVCPEDGEYQIRGAVTDAHPAGLDGVSFRMEQIASADYGQGLVELGNLVADNTTARPEPPVFPLAYAVAESTAINVPLHQRGDPEQLGDTIPRRWLSVFGGNSLGSDDRSGRRELADQILANPLFARVIVNRIWQYHFGRGLVATPNDFGTRGTPPSHPELLDWLAAQFRSGGYRLKPMHRMIMQTAAYQRSGLSNPDVTRHDPPNQWLSRFSRRRLSAEEIRDTLLVSSGQIDMSFGQAHPFPPESTWTFTQHNPFNAVYDTNRRSVFLMVQRQRRHPYLALFDGADPNSSTASRQSTTVPTQALFFLNDPFYHAQSNAVANRFSTQSDDAETIRSAFQLLFQRNPTVAEIQAGRSFLADYPGNLQEKTSAYARVLMASNEYLYVD
ncbi:MAG: DUF1553 domain-containing protein, partial [Planctomycetales bacterium]|nr:DUF1553 domain-containing protein [Planctomycetales bacterium]